VYTITYIGALFLNLLVGLEAVTNFVEAQAELLAKGPLVLGVQEENTFKAIFHFVEEKKIVFNLMSIIEAFKFK